MAAKTAMGGKRSEGSEENSKRSLSLSLLRSPEEGNNRGSGAGSPGHSSRSSSFLSFLLARGARGVREAKRESNGCDGDKERERG